MREYSVRWLGIAVLIVAVGCGGQKEESQGRASSAAKETATSEAAPVVDKATAATITGRVVFSGTAPPMQPIDLSSEQVCQHRADSHPVYTENVVVNDNGTLRNVFVYVKEGLGDQSFPAPTEPVVLDQVGCQYIPHVFGIQVGQPLTIKNSDEGVLHNIHAISEVRNGFNFGMPKVMESTKKFKKPEVMVRIKCDVHGWMNSYAGVLKHPYHAVTGKDGTFELSPLPPGEYVIETWHEEYGPQTQTVALAERDSKEITFTYRPAS
jgi:subtilisin family serine protease